MILLSSAHNFFPCHKSQLSNSEKDDVPRAENGGFSHTKGKKTGSTHRELETLTLNQLQIKMCFVFFSLPVKLLSIHFEPVAFLKVGLGLNYHFKQTYIDVECVDG